MVKFPIFQYLKNKASETVFDVIIVFYIVENGGIGQKIMGLACTGAEIFHFFICPYMGI